MIDETLFPDSDNEVVLILIDPTDLSDTDNYPNGKPYNFIERGVTLMELYVGCSKFSSATNDLTYDSNGRIIITIDNVTSLVRNIRHSSYIKVYDDSHPKGQFINDNKTDDSTLMLTVVDPTIC